MAGKRKIPLRTFLRKEVLSSRIRLKPTDDHISDVDSLFGFESQRSKARENDDVDSLFGEPLDPDAKLGPLERFAKQTYPRKRVKRASDQVIEELKEELRTLMFYEVKSEREGELLERQRTALVEEIRKLEVLEESERWKRQKAIYHDTTLPEPISAREKELLMSTTKQVAESRQGIQKPPKPLKLNAEIMEQYEEDYDGEDLLHLPASLTKRLKSTKLSEPAPDNNALTDLAAAHYAANERILGMIEQGGNRAVLERESRALIKELRDRENEVRKATVVRERREEENRLRNVEKERLMRERQARRDGRYSGLYSRLRMGERI